MFDSQGRRARGPHRPDPRQARVRARRAARRRSPRRCRAPTCSSACPSAASSTAEMVQGMAPRPIIFAMANPDPEIPYERREEARPDAIVATGRSDYPNQVNNVLGFPFMFRGALDCRAREHHRGDEGRRGARARRARARGRARRGADAPTAFDSSTFGPDYIIPKPFDPRVLLVGRAGGRRGGGGVGRRARSRSRTSTPTASGSHLLVERAREHHAAADRAARRTTRPRGIVFPDGTQPARSCAPRRSWSTRASARPVLLGDPRAHRAKRRAQPRRARRHGDRDRSSHEPRTPSSRSSAVEAAPAQGHDPGIGAAAPCVSTPGTRAMMVREGLADGMVGGLEPSLQAHDRPRAAGARARRRAAALVSGVYAMLFKNRKLFLGDCTVNMRARRGQSSRRSRSTRRASPRRSASSRASRCSSYSDFGEHRRTSACGRCETRSSIVRERWPDLDDRRRDAGRHRGRSATRWRRTSRSARCPDLGERARLPGPHVGQHRLQAARAPGRRRSARAARGRHRRRR